LKGDTGNDKVTTGRGRRRKQPPYDLKEGGGYWKFKEEALDRIVWGILFGRGRQTTE
jgi:hypothetical protein